MQTYSLNWIMVQVGKFLPPQPKKYNAYYNIYMQYKIFDTGYLHKIILKIKLFYNFLLVFPAVICSKLNVNVFSRQLVT